MQLIGARTFMEQDQAKRFGRWLREQRQAARISKRELARRTGRSPARTRRQTRTSYSTNKRKEEDMQLQQQIQPTATPRGVLAMLRALVPRRPVSPWETLLIAELQANRLLEYFEITSAPVPEEIVSELPRIRIVREP